MGNPKMANHVKFVRPVYLRRIRRLAKERRVKKKDVVHSDLLNFDQSLYDFFLNIKKRHSKE